MDRPHAAYKGDEPYVFVCYAHEDGDVVYPEMAWLQDQKVRLWYDEGITGGHVWRQEIYNALESSDCRIVLSVIRISLIKPLLCGLMSRTTKAKTLKSRNGLHQLLTLALSTLGRDHF